MRRIAWILSLALSLGHAAAASGQDALVLSGGGARGLAHAGVFEAMEELGHDPDIVVGTSMGAVVGALYAAGYGSAEIKERILEIDWTSVFTPTPVLVGPDRSIRYPMATLDLDLEEFRVARGLVGQWQINRALARLLFDANARARGDFDRLARRYRAVAADLRTGEAVVLESGDLARAARASMAVPAMFAPVVWDGRVLVDGGIVNNLPTDVARGLGAEYVVAVDVGRPPEEIHSQAPFAVLSRALDLMQENTQRDFAPPDVLLAPAIEPRILGANFPTDPRPLFTIGLETAREALPRRPAGAGASGRPLPPPPDSLGGLLLEAPDSSLAALARNLFAGIAPGRYDPDAVLRAVDRLYTTGLFEAVWPRVVDDPEEPGGAPLLAVRLDAQPELAAAAAAGYENDRGARAWGLLERHSRVGRRPATLGASASTDGLERAVALSARVYPLSRPTISWTVGAYAREHDVRRFADDALGDTDVLRLGGWAGLELPHILQERVTTAALRAEWLREEDGRSGFSAGPWFRLASLGPDVMIVGAPLLVEGELRWGDVAYRRLRLRGSRTFTPGMALLAGVFDFRAVTAGAPGHEIPALGDDHSVPGLRWGEERGEQTGVAGLDAAYPVMEAFLRLRLRSGLVRHPARGWGGSDAVSGAQLAVVWRNPVLGVTWGFSVNTRGDRRFDLSLGRAF